MEFNGNKQSKEQQEFQAKVKLFKEQMSEGMTNLKFIHIN